MEILEGVEFECDRSRGVSVAIGNFDGVHRGHQAVVAAAGREAERLGARLAVLTFAPHPRRFFQPDGEPFQLTRRPLKTRRLAALGVDRLIVQPFNAAFAAISAETFAREILGERLGARHVVVGADFRFGSKRRGDAAMLAEIGAEIGAEAGYDVTALEPVGAGEVFSSSAIRRALRDADPVEAARILGDWHRIEGVVEQGDRRGRELGYPTANMSLDGVLTPAYGIYAVFVEVLDGPHAGLHRGVASLGLRPTFNKTTPNFEAHLFDFEGDLYGATVSVGLAAYLRPEIKFDDLAALIAQMDADSAAARAALDAAGAPWERDGQV